MIDYLREHTHGYPGEYNGFPTPESWDNCLKEEIIIPLRNAREEQTTQINEYDEEFHSYPINFVKQENGFIALDLLNQMNFVKSGVKEKKKLMNGGKKNLRKLLKI